MNLYNFIIIQSLLFEIYNICLNLVLFLCNLCIFCLKPASFPTSFDIRGWWFYYTESPDQFICSLQFGMVLEHSDAVRQIAVGSVVTQGHEATVQHDLIGLWSMADDACSHPDCDVVELTGANSILLGVCNECTYNLEFLNIQL